jgi:ribose 5-phosphate isomerase RpiB
MRVVAIGSDHAGASPKEEIVRFLKEETGEVTDVGTHDASPIDHPAIGRELGTLLLERERSPCCPPASWLLSKPDQPGL